MTTRARWFLVGASLLLPGCFAVNARLSVAPTVDTLGQVGVETRLGAGFGLGAAGNEEAGGVTLDGHFSTGYLGQPDEVVSVGGGGGLALVYLPRGGVGLRAALVGSGRWADGVLVTRQESGALGVEGGLVLLPVGIGVLIDLGLRAELVISAAEVRGVFAFPVAIELFGATNPRSFLPF